MNISNNLSSINAHQTMMNNSANNVANINTDKFVPSDTIINDNGNLISANTRKANDAGSDKSQTDLSKEIPDQMIAEKVTAANVSAIRTQDEMFGSLLDMKV